jgi:hypothetical protein
MKSTCAKHLKNDVHIRVILEKWSPHGRNTWKMTSTCAKHLRNDEHICETPEEWLPHTRNTWRMMSTCAKHLKNDGHIRETLKEWRPHARNTWRMRSTYAKYLKKMTSTCAKHLKNYFHMPETLEEWRPHMRNTWRMTSTCAKHLKNDVHMREILEEWRPQYFQYLASESRCGWPYTYLSLCTPNNRSWHTSCRDTVLEAWYNILSRPSNKPEYRTLHTAGINRDDQTRHLKQCDVHLSIVKAPYVHTALMTPTLTHFTFHGQFYPVQIPTETKYKAIPVLHQASSLGSACGSGRIAERNFHLGNRRWWSASRCGHFTASHTSNGRQGGSQSRFGRSENDSHPKSNPNTRSSSLWPSHYTDWAIASPVEAKDHANSEVWKQQLKSGATTFPPVRDNGRHSYIKAGVSICLYSCTSRHCFSTPIKKLILQATVPYFSSTYS